MTPTEVAAAAFAAHGRRVEALAARVLLATEDARDVASDTFVALIERGPDEERAILPWLLRSVRNRAVDVIRARERSRRRPLFAPESGEANAERLASRAQVASLVGTALERLEARDRRALELRYLSGRTYEDVGTELRVSAAQARVVVHRARGRMRRQVVGVLAEHHGTTEACRSRLLRGVTQHAGCGTCGAVGDELAALASFSVTPLAVPAVTRIARLFARAPVPREGGRIAEAVAALAMVGSGLAPAGPATPATVPVPLPARVSVHARAQAREVVTPAHGVLAAARDAGAPVTSRDARGDAGVRSTVRRVALPIRLPDLPDPAMGPGLDIRSFGIATLVEGRHPVGLRFTWRLAGEPSADEGFRVHWLGEGGCWAFVGTSRSTALDGHATGGAGCPSEGVAPGPGWRSPAAAAIDRDRVEIVVRFADLDPTSARLLHPGARMRKIRSWTSYAGDGRPLDTNVNEADVAPERGTRLEYVIPKTSPERPA